MVCFSRLAGVKTAKATLGARFCDSDMPPLTSTCSILKVSPGHDTKADLLTGVYHLVAGGGISCYSRLRRGERPGRRRSGLLGLTGSLARAPRNPSDGWALYGREAVADGGSLRSPTDRSRPRLQDYRLRRSSASNGSNRIPRTKALEDGSFASSAKSA